MNSKELDAANAMQEGEKLAESIQAGIRLYRTKTGRAVTAIEIDNSNDAPVVTIRTADAPPTVESALQALLDWGRVNTSPTQWNSPHQLLIDAAKALGQ